MDSRDMKLYKQKTPNPSALIYPFEYINDYVIPTPLINQPDEDVGNFPNNIEEYYWIYEGVNEEENWRCLCKLNNGNYAFFTAGCCYTGFDVSGSTDVYVSKSPFILINYAMTEKDYILYKKDATILVLDVEPEIYLKPEI